MGRKKGFSEDDRIEQLEKEVRELKSINRSLTRQLKKLNRGYYKIEEDDLEPPIKIKKEVLISDRCPSCGLDKIEEVRIADRSFDRCNTCGFRSKARKAK